MTPPLIQLVQAVASWWLVWTNPPDADLMMHRFYVVRVDEVADTLHGDYWPQALPGAKDSVRFQLPPVSSGATWDIHLRSVDTTAVNWSDPSNIVRVSQ